MRSKGFIAGFSKVAGPLDLAAKGAKKLFSVNNVLTGVGAVMEGRAGMQKMRAAGSGAMRQL